LLIRLLYIDGRALFFSRSLPSNGCIHHIMFQTKTRLKCQYLKKQTCFAINAIYVWFITSCRNLHFTVCVYSSVRMQLLENGWTRDHEIWSWRILLQFVEIVIVYRYLL
jgi:hypothetical protein